MRIKDWMTPEPITVSRTAPIAQAQDLMLYRRIRHLPVVDDRRLVGIITDRDVRTVLPSPATSFSVGEIRFLLDKLQVGEVMSRSVITVRPDQPIADAVRLMLENKIGSLPVVSDGHLVGIITELDLLRAFASSLGETVNGPTTASVQNGATQRRILVPLDGTPGSESVLPRIGDIARAEGAAVRLLHVSAPVREIRADGRVVVYADQETARVEAEVRAYFKRVASSLGDVPLELAVRFGEPVEEIVREADEAGVEVIAMATHRRSGLSRVMKGSVAEEVERATRIPVILVRYGEVSVA